jgi:hypothetical protein
MQAIIVKYLGPTNTQGARLKACTASGECVTVGKTYADDNTDRRRAVAKLCAKLGWSDCDKMIRGGLKDADVFVFLPTGCSCPASAFQGMRKRSRKGKRR